MEGLANYSSDENSESEEDADGDASDSKGSDQDKIEKRKCDEKLVKSAEDKIVSQAPVRPPETEPSKKRRILPSASALLSGSAGRPSFLSSSAASAAVFEIPMDEVQQKKAAVEQSSASGSKESGAKHDSAPVSSTPGSTHASMTTGKGSAASAAAAKAKAGKDQKEKGDVKDKLKAARLKGQSAHARWKSEGEMLLRQQYD
jgi:hypothetical protein